MMIIIYNPRDERPDLDPADTVLKAATAAHPKLRYPAGGLASRLRLLRRFAPAGLVDAGIRKDLQLDVAPAEKIS